MALGLSRAAKEHPGNRRFCPREKPHQLKRKVTFGEIQGIAAARVVKSLDKIFNMEEQETLAKC